MGEYKFENCMCVSDYMYAVEDIWVRLYMWEHLYELRGVGMYEHV